MTDETAKTDIKIDDQSNLRNDIRKQFEGLAKVELTSKRAAIKLFCIECMGGSTRDAKACDTKSCFLWRHAYKRGAEAASIVAADGTAKPKRVTHLTKMWAEKAEKKATAAATSETPKTAEEPKTEHPKIKR